MLDQSDGYATGTRDSRDGDMRQARLMRHRRCGSRDVMTAGFMVCGSWHGSMVSVCLNNRMRLQLRRYGYLRWSAAAVITLGLLAAPLASGCSPSADAASGDRLSVVIERAQSVGVPSGAMAHVSEGRVVNVRTFGDATVETTFLWGSVSKPVAAAVTRSLAANGLLDLSTPAAQLASGASEAPVRDLLSHTAGLPFGAEVLDEGRPGSDAIAVVRDNPHPSTPSDYSYSSLGYMQLQAVLESASDRSYDALVNAMFPGVRASVNGCGDVIQGHRLAGPFAWPLDTPYDGAGGPMGTRAETSGSSRLRV